MSPSTQDGASTTAGTRPAPRPDASMTLLVEVMERPLDPGYALAAERRATTGAQRAPLATRAWLLALAVLLGVMTVTAVRALNAPEPSGLAARTLLEEEITGRQDEVSSLTGQIDTLTTDIESLRDDVLGEDSGATGVAADDGVLSGSLAVQGPGAVVTLRDANTLDDAAADPNSRVQDDDLQVVVNALWAAGAEAMAINDHRLTPLSAVRAAGDAILVDLEPLVSPYRITVIGDPGELQAGLARSDAGQYLVMLTNYGIQNSVVGQSDLSVPADTSLRLYHARPVDSAPTPAPSSDVGAGQGNEQGNSR